MDLFREVHIDELEKEIEKLKLSVMTYMNKDSISFLNEFNKKNYEVAIEIALSEFPFGLQYIVSNLENHIKAKHLIEQGEKIYTTLVVNRID